MGGGRWREKGEGGGKGRGCKAVSLFSWLYSCNSRRVHSKVARVFWSRTAKTCQNILQCICKIWQIYFNFDLPAQYFPCIITVTPILWVARFLWEWPRFQFWRGNMYTYFLNYFFRENCSSKFWTSHFGFPCQNLALADPWGGFLKISL